MCDKERSKQNFRRWLRLEEIESTRQIPIQYETDAISRRSYSEDNAPSLNIPSINSFERDGSNIPHTSTRSNETTTHYARISYATTGTTSTSNGSRNCLEQQIIVNATKPTTVDVTVDFRKKTTQDELNIRRRERERDAEDIRNIIADYTPSPRTGLEEIEIPLVEAPSIIAQSENVGDGRPTFFRNKTEYKFDLDRRSTAKREIARSGNAKHRSKSMNEVSFQSPKWSKPVESPSNSCERKKFYEPEDARKFIKEQRKKRRSSLSSGARERAAKIEKEAIKKRLEELNKNSKQILSKNLKRKLGSKESGVNRPLASKSNNPPQTGILNNTDMKKSVSKCSKTIKSSEKDTKAETTNNLDIPICVNEPFEMQHLEVDNKNHKQPSKKGYNEAPKSTNLQEEPKLNHWMDNQVVLETTDGIVHIVAKTNGNECGSLKEIRTVDLTKKLSGRYADNHEYSFSAKEYQDHLMSGSKSERNIPLSCRQKQVSPNKKNMVLTKFENKKSDEEYENVEDEELTELISEPKLLDSGKSKSSTALLENQKRIGLLRKQETDNHSFSAIKSFNFDKENVARKMLTPLTNGDLQPDSPLKEYFPNSLKSEGKLKAMINEFSSDDARFKNQSETFQQNEENVRHGFIPTTNEYVRSKEHSQFLQENEEVLSASSAGELQVKDCSLLSEKNVINDKEISETTSKQSSSGKSQSPIRKAPQKKILRIPPGFFSDKEISGTTFKQSTSSKSQSPIHTVPQKKILRIPPGFFSEIEENVPKNLGNKENSIKPPSATDSTDEELTSTTSQFSSKSSTHSTRSEQFEDSGAQLINYLLQPGIVLESPYNFIVAVRNKLDSIIIDDPSNNKNSATEIMQKPQTSTTDLNWKVKSTESLALKSSESSVTKLPKRTESFIKFSFISDKDIEFVSTPVSAQSNLSSKVSKKSGVQKRENDDTTVSSSIFSSPEKIDQQFQTDNSNSTVVLESVSPLSLESVEKMKIASKMTQNFSQKEDYEDSTSSSGENFVLVERRESQKCLHSKKISKTLKETEKQPIIKKFQTSPSQIALQKLLYDFNRNLSQVIEYNEKFKHTIDKSHQILSPKRSSQLEKLSEEYTTDFEESARNNENSEETSEKSSIRENSKISSEKNTKTSEATGSSQTALIESSMKIHQNDSKSELKKNPSKKEILRSNVIEKYKNPETSSKKLHTPSKEEKERPPQLELNISNETAASSTTSRSTNTSSTIETSIFTDKNSNSSQKKPKNSNSTPSTQLVSEHSNETLQESVKKIDSSRSSNESTKEEACEIICAPGQGSKNFAKNGSGKKNKISSRKNRQRASSKNSKETFIQTHINTNRGDFTNHKNEKDIFFDEQLDSAIKKSTMFDDSSLESTRSTISKAPSYCSKVDALNSTAQATSHQVKEKTHTTTTTTTKTKYLATKPTKKNSEPTGKQRKAISSEVIGMFNQSDLELSMLSSCTSENVSESSLNYSNLGLYEKLIKTETTKSEQLTALLKSRENALLDRTKGQIAWLEVQKERFKAIGLTTQIATIKKKQRGILLKMEKEREEIKRLLQSSKYAQAKHSASISHNESERIPNESGSQLSLAKSSATNPAVLPGIFPIVKNQRGVKDQQHKKDTVTNSEKVLRGNYNLESSQSLEDLLRQREADLQKRREHVERLMQWHQRLDQEEAEVAQLEHMLFKYNNAHTHQQLQQFSEVECNGKNFKLFASQHKSPEKRSEKRRAAKMEKRLKEIDRSLRELSSISTTNSNTTTATVTNEDSVSGSCPADAAVDYVRTTGIKLNKLWRRLTSQQTEKFEPHRRYKLCKNDLERLYEDAKIVVLQNFAEDEERIAAELLEKSSCNLSASEAKTPPLKEIRSTAAGSTVSLPQGYYSPSAAEEDFNVHTANKTSRTSSECSLIAELNSADRNRSIKNNIERFLASSQQLTRQHTGLQRSLSDTQIADFPSRISKINTQLMSQRNLTETVLSSSQNSCESNDTYSENIASGKNLTAVTSADTLKSVQSLNSNSTWHEPDYNFVEELNIPSNSDCESNFDIESPLKTELNNAVSSNVATLEARSVGIVSNLMNNTSAGKSSVRLNSEISDDFEKTGKIRSSSLMGSSEPEAKKPTDLTKTSQLNEIKTPIDILCNSKSALVEVNTTPVSQSTKANEKHSQSDQNISTDPSYTYNFENISSGIQSPSGCATDSSNNKSSFEFHTDTSANASATFTKSPQSTQAKAFTVEVKDFDQSNVENNIIYKYEADFAAHIEDETFIEDLSLPHFEKTFETTQDDIETEIEGAHLRNETHSVQKHLKERGNDEMLPPPSSPSPIPQPQPPPTPRPSAKKSAGTSANSGQQMPDIINEVEKGRYQHILIENEQLKQYEHVTAVPYMYVREIPNKPPPPYVPPAHGSPMTTIFPSEERIKDITYRRSHELYCEILKTDYTNDKGEKLPPVMEEKITNIYERIILDICREYLTEHQEVLTQGDPTNFHSQLAFFNPPDRLRCIQQTIYKEVRRCLAMDKTSPKRSQVYSIYGYRAKRDHIGKIIMQEMYDEDDKWCNFHREENEVLDLILEEMIVNCIKELCKKVIVEEGGTIEDEIEESSNESAAVDLGEPSEKLLNEATSRVDNADVVTANVTTSVIVTPNVVSLSDFKATADKDSPLASN